MSGSDPTPAANRIICAAQPTGFAGMTAAAGMLPLRAVGTNLADDKGAIYRITGTSLGGFQSTLQVDGTWNYPYRTITVGGVAYVGILDRLAQAGLNCVRLLICEDVCRAGVKPLAYVNPTFNPDWFTDPQDTATVLDGVQILDSVIAYLGRLGLRVILDMHALAPNGDNTVATAGLWYTTATRLAASTSPPTHSSTDLRNETDWLDAWTAVAQRYLGNATVIGADLVNEPYAASWGDGNGQTDICGAYTRCADAILAVNPDWLVFCEGIYEVLDFGPVNGGSVGIQWGAGLDRAAAHPVAPKVANRVVYSPHDYGPGLGNWGYFGAARYPANMTAVWNQMWGYLVKTGVAPVLIGEIGDMLVAGANNGFETPAKYAQAQQWIGLLMHYVAGATSTGGTPDVPAGCAGFSWNWFCWSTNGFSGTPGSITNTNLLMGDFDTLNTNVMQYVTPHLAPKLLATVPVPVTITLSAPATAPLSVPWYTRNGTATAGVHYVAATGTVRFGVGQSAATVTVALQPLTATAPGSLYFLVGVSAGSGYTIKDGTGKDGTGKDGTGKDGTGKDGTGIVTIQYG
jgi:endoglucanase